MGSNPTTVRKGKWTLGSPLHRRCPSGPEGYKWKTSYVKFTRSVQRKLLPYLFPFSHTPCCPPHNFPSTIHSLPTFFPMPINPLSAHLLPPAHHPLLPVEHLLSITGISRSQRDPEAAFDKLPLSIKWGECARNPCPGMHHLIKSTAPSLMISSPRAIHPSALRDNP